VLAEDGKAGVESDLLHVRWILALYSPKPLLRWRQASLLQTAFLKTARSQRFSNFFVFT